MQDSGTIQQDNTLSNPTNEDQYLEMVNKAVNSGDDAELNRLMSMELDFSVSDANTENTEVPAAASAAADELKDPLSTEPNKEIASAPITEAVENTAEQPRVTEPVAPVQTDDKDEVIRKLQEDLHKAKSDIGRIPALQSRLSQLESSLRTNEAAKKAATSVQPVETDEDKKIKEQLQQLREVDPGTADILEAMQKRMAAQMEAYQRDVPTKFAEELNLSQQEARLVQEYEKVVTVHPEFDAIRRHVSWAAWKASLTPEQRAWAESDTADQVIVAVQEFKRANGLMPAAAVTQAQATVAAPVATVAAPVVPDPAAQARERKLQNSASGKEGSLKSEGVTDPDAQFSAEYRRVLNEIGYKD